MADIMELPAGDFDTFCIYDYSLNTHSLLEFYWIWGFVSDNHSPVIDALFLQCRVSETVLSVPEPEPKTHRLFYTRLSSHCTLVDSVIPHSVNTLGCWKSQCSNLAHTWRYHTTHNIYGPRDKLRHVFKRNVYKQIWRMEAHWQIIQFKILYIGTFM